MNLRTLRNGELHTLCCPADIVMVIMSRSANEMRGTCANMEEKREAKVGRKPEEEIYLFVAYITTLSVAQII